MHPVHDAHAYHVTPLLERFEVPCGTFSSFQPGQQLGSGLNLVQDTEVRMGDMKTMLGASTSSGSGFGIYRVCPLPERPEDERCVEYSSASRQHPRQPF